MTIPSPIGKTGRALRNAFAEAAAIDASHLERRCIADCLEHCLCRDTGTTYCILQALSRATKGDTKQGLVFASGKIQPSDRIMTVAELMTELRCGVPVKS